jgi:hypothetical protein
MLFFHGQKTHLKRFGHLGVSILLLLFSEWTVGEKDCKIKGGTLTTQWYHISLEGGIKKILLLV